MISTLVAPRALNAVSKAFATIFPGSILAGVSMPWLMEGMSQISFRDAYKMASDMRFLFGRFPRLTVEYDRALARSQTRQLTLLIDQFFRQREHGVEIPASEEVWFAAACAVVAAHAFCRAQQHHEPTQSQQFIIGRLGFWADLAVSLWFQEPIRKKARVASPFRAKLTGDMLRQFDAVLEKRYAAYENAIHCGLRGMSQPNFTGGHELQEQIRHHLFSGSDVGEEDYCAKWISIALLAGFGECVKLFGNPSIFGFLAAWRRNRTSNFWATYMLPRQYGLKDSSE